MPKYDVETRNMKIGSEGGVEEVPCSMLSYRCGLDQPLLGRDLEHVVQLQPGRGQLLLGGPVVALALPLAPGHHEEHGEAHQGDERHPAHNGAHNQGELFSL